MAKSNHLPFPLFSVRFSLFFPSLCSNFEFFFFVKYCILNHNDDCEILLIPFAFSLLHASLRFCRSFCIWDTLLPSFENCVARVPLTTGGEPSSLLFFPREGKVVIGCKKGYIRILDLRGYRSGNFVQHVFSPPFHHYYMNVFSYLFGGLGDGDGVGDDRSVFMYSIL